MTRCWVIAVFLWLLVAGRLVAADRVDTAPKPPIFRAGRYLYQPSSVTLSAAWVSEALTRDVLQGHAVRGRVGFHVDPNLPKDQRASEADYEGTEYDRFHLAPSGNYHAQADQDATYNYSNVVPGNAALNRGVWRTIEGCVIQIIEEDVRGDKLVLAITLPIYHYPADVKLKRAGRVLVPTAIAKAVLITKHGQPQSMLAWLCPNIDPGSEHEQHYRVSVDRVEAESGWDVFWSLDDAIEEKLESQEPGP